MATSGPSGDTILPSIGNPKPSNSEIHTVPLTHNDCRSMPGSIAVVGYTVATGTYYRHNYMTRLRPPSAASTAMLYDSCSCSTFTPYFRVVLSLVTKVHSQETRREGLRNKGGRLTNANTTHEWVSLFSECMATGDKNYQYT